MDPRPPTSAILVTTLLLVAPAGAATEDQTPTFSRDVAPIFFDHCVTCHRPGQVAPMSLLSYREARPWAKSVARQVASGAMPPWSAESDRLEWSNDLSLTAKEIATIESWVRAGAPEGDPDRMPEPPTFPEDWTLGEPDLMLTLNPVQIPASGEDLFPRQVLQLEGLDETRWVRAIEFLPGDRRAAHHFQMTYRTPGAGTRAVGESREEGDLEGRGGSGVFGIWTAGMPPYVFPEGMGRIVSPTTEIVADLHYHPFGEDTVDQTRIGIHFGEGPLRKEVATMFGTNTGIRIPPGAEEHTETALHVFDRDMRILAFSPHLHVRGKAMRYELTTPDGRTETLLDVPEYDYNWQWLYYPTEPVEVPAGSVLEITAAWDNSPANPVNPDPTEEVIYRGDTFSEMFVGFFEAVDADGVFHQPAEPAERLRDLLARHDPEHSFLVGGFLPFAFYAPEEGEGWLYLTAGVAMFSISLDQIEWDGDSLRITAQFPTPEASATTSTIEGELDGEGRLVGTFHYGIDSDQPMRLPLLARPMTGAGGDRSTSGTTGAVNR